MQPHEKQYSDLILHVPNRPWMRPDIYNWPYPPTGELLARDFQGHQWVSYETYDLVPLEVSPRAQTLAVYDRRTDTYVVCDRRARALHTFSEEDYPDWYLDSRGFWSERTRAQAGDGAEYVWRYDLDQRRWFRTDEKLKVMRITTDRPYTWKLRLNIGEWKELVADWVEVSPRLPEGQVTATIEGKLYVWDIAKERPVRLLYANDVSISPSGELGDLFGHWGIWWRYKVVDLESGTVIDRFFYNIKGNDHFMWVPCTLLELETALADVRQLLDQSKRGNPD